MNDTQDKQFVALELTKIAYPPIRETCGAKLDEIYHAYEYFLKSTMEITEDIGTIVSLKEEARKLRLENERLKENNRDAFKPFCSDLMAILTSAQGDMEPYVYGSLTNIIKAKIQ